MLAWIVFLKRNIKRLTICGLYGLILAPAVYAQQKQPYLELEKLLNQQAYQQAFELSITMLDDYAGEPDFDYLAGLAAYQAGYFDDAVFAFERVLIMNPKHVTSRLYLAFGYFKVDNFKASQKELRELKKLPLKQEDMAKVDEYLERIAELERKTIKNQSVTVSLAYAYDDNANSGTELDTINLPILGEIVLFDGSKRNPDQLTQANIQYQYLKNLTQNSGIYGQISANLTEYQTQIKLNRTIYSVLGGYQHKIDNWQYKATAYWQPMKLDDQSYRSAYGVFLEAGTSIFESSNISVVFGGSDIDNKLDDNLDMKQFSIQGKYAFNAGSSIHNVELTRGREDAKLDSGEHNGRDYWQLLYRYTLMNWLFGGNLIADVSYQNSEYSSLHPLFAVQRDENQTSVQIMYHYPILPDLAASLRIRRSEKDSSLDLYSFDKNESWLTLNYSF